MLPSTTVAALILTALIPGYAYLRLTEDARRPRMSSTLEEFLEVLAVGLATTGVALGAVIVADPERVAGILTQVSLDAPDELRAAVVLVAVVSGLALVIALIGAAATRLPRRGSYSASVWRSTLGLRRKGHIPYVVLDLADGGGRVEGVLHSYTTLDDDSPRDIALLSPKVSRNDGQKWDSGAEYVIISGEEIQKIWLTLAPDPGRQG